MQRHQARSHEVVHMQEDHSRFAAHMPHPSQQIRFCRSPDGVRIAYAVSGNGPPLIKAANWVTHLDHDWDSPAWNPWLTTLSRHHQLIRYDPRGCGLSDRDMIEFSFEKYVEDLEVVVEAAGLKRFVLFGFAGGGAIAVAYAARHPDRVSHLILYGPFIRGRFARCTTPEQLAEEQALLHLIEMGWGKDDPSFRQLFVNQFMPGGTAQQWRSFNELMCLSASPQNAAGLMRAWFASDVSALAPMVRCPTLVLHPRGAIRVPFEEGRALAGLIPGALFVPLDSRNLILLEHEPAWQQLVEAFDAFVPAASGSATGPARLRLDELTAREKEMLELVARGLTNTEIAQQLGIREKTARNHLSSILGKLDLHSRAQAIVRAREVGIGLGASR